MEKLFVPYEMANLLKEKGFDEICFAVFLNQKSNQPGYLKQIEFTICNEDTIAEPNWEDATQFVTYNNSKIYPQYTSAPLYQQVVDWFENKGIYIYIDLDITSSWNYHVGPAYPPIEKLFPNEKWIHSNYVYSNRNEALTEAIYEALKLI